MTTVKVIELQGESDESWEDAAESAVQDASETLQGISGIEVVSQTADVDDDGQITGYNTTVHVAFTLQRD
jgi:dodecin